MSSLQCLKRVHLEIHRKDLLEYSKATEASFAIGHEVGDLAIRLYGRGRGLTAFLPGEDVVPLSPELLTMTWLSDGLMGP